jgi:MFS-type transporter involved in bile tolerance (Atg22 family)
MDKEKLIKGGIWLSGFSISIILAALALFIGFNKQRQGDNTILIIGLVLLPIVFFCAYKGFRLILDAIFK